jgi:hypothetical protein
MWPFSWSQKVNKPQKNQKIDQNPVLGLESLMQAPKIR